MTAVPVGPPLRPSQRLRAGWRRALRLWDSIAIYLPLLMMVMLALGTYWLVRNTPAIPGSQTPVAARHEPDYFMRRFSVKNFDETGKLKSEIQGLEARHYPDTDTLEIDQARIRSVSPKGLVTIATGKRALSNSDGSEVQLTGDALVVREAGVDNTGKQNVRLEFRGEFLHAFLNEERVRSHKPVVLTRGNDQFTGDTFAYDNLDGVAELKGRVRGVMMPRNATGKPPAR